MKHELRYTSTKNLGGGHYHIEAACSCGGAEYTTETVAGIGIGRSNIRAMHARHVKKAAGQEREDG
jgi:hypothetical protein